MFVRDTPGFRSKRGTSLGATHLHSACVQKELRHGLEDDLEEERRLAEELYVDEKIGRLRYQDRLQMSHQLLVDRAALRVKDRRCREDILRQRRQSEVKKASVLIGKEGVR